MRTLLIKPHAPAILTTIYGPHPNPEPKRTSINYAEKSDRGDQFKKEAKTGITQTGETSIKAKAASPTAATVGREVKVTANLLPLHTPAAANDERTVRFLLAKGADWKQRDAQGKLAIERTTSPAVWKLFLLKMAPSWDIHAAAESGDVADLMLMIGEGFNVSRKNKHGETALHLASQKGHERVVEILLANGAQKCLEDRALAIIGKSDHAQKDIAPLHLTAANGSTSIVETMIKHGAKLDTVDAKGRTALWWAMRYQHFDTAKVLVSNGANVNASDDSGWIPFLSAAHLGSLDLVKMMVERKADLPSTVSKKTALTLAKEARTFNPALVIYLKRIGVGKD
ncbi:hypothetical protein HDU96_007576 [Phlyctochytrium bullatum]|nr:hypothetical protein HDU96_007576 [Phlyctochytrium bullatum]